jgi:hypothetical protein
MSLRQVSENLTPPIEMKIGTGLGFGWFGVLTCLYDTSRLHLDTNKQSQHSQHSWTHHTKSNIPRRNSWASAQ